MTIYVAEISNDEDFAPDERKAFTTERKAAEWIYKNVKNDKYVFEQFAHDYSVDNGLIDFEEDGIISFYDTLRCNRDFVEYCINYIIEYGNNFNCNIWEVEFE